MVTVDNRGGSLGIDGAKRRLRDLHDAGVDAELGVLEYGDYGFAGNGPDGATVMVGIELKRTQDMLTSLRGKRLVGHQLPGMDVMYEIPWLVTEGIWREGPNGVFQHYQGTWTTASLGSNAITVQTIQSWILSALAPFPKIRHWHTATAKDTARFIKSLHRWWTEKEFDEHRTSQVIYVPAPGRAMFSEPSDFVKGLTAMVEGLGWQKAHAIEQALPVRAKFGALRAMTLKELEQFDGIGPTLAKRIQEALA